MSGSNVYAHIRPALLCPLAISGGRGGVAVWRCRAQVVCSGGVDICSGVIIKKYLSCCAPVVTCVVYTTKNIKCGLGHSFRSHYFTWLHLPAPSPQIAGAPADGKPASRAREPPTLHCKHCISAVHTHKEPVMSPQPIPSLSGFNPIMSRRVTVRRRNRRRCCRRTERLWLLVPQDRAQGKRNPVL